jgi:hypothetical protein
MYKTFKELDRNIKKIWRQEYLKLRVNRYDLYKQSINEINNFYETHKSINEDNLNKRVMDLKNDVEGYKVITVPVLMAVVFGVFFFALQIIYDIIKDLIGILKDKYEDAKLILNNEQMKEFDNIYKSVINEILPKYALLGLILFLVLLLFVFFIHWLFKMRYKDKSYIYQFKEFEVSKIEGLLMGNKTILHIENDKYKLEYELSKVEEKSR